MENIPTKATGDDLTATEWNQVPTELENLILSMGISLTSSDLLQVAKAIAAYAAHGDFYTDGGIADAYNLSVQGSQEAPEAYTNGMRVRFLPGNANTGASTINVAGLGVKNLVDKDGNALVGGELITTNECSAWYDGTSFRLQQSAINPFKIVQVLSTLDASTATTTTSATLVGSGVSQAITLKKATNKVLAIVSTHFGSSTTAIAYASLLRGATDLTPVGATAMKHFDIYPTSTEGANERFAPMDFNFLDTPGSVGPHTYQLSWATNFGTLYLNRRGVNANFSGVTSIVLLEIEA